MDNHGLNTYNRGDQWIKACGFNEADIIRRLLDEGADVEQEPSNPLYRGQISPLLQACRHGRLDTARLLFVRERVESQDVCRGESRALADSSAARVFHAARRPRAAYRGGPPPSRLLYAT